MGIGHIHTHPTCCNSVDDNAVDIAIVRAYLCRLLQTNDINRRCPLTIKWPASLYLLRVLFVLYVHAQENLLYGSTSNTPVVFLFSFFDKDKSTTSPFMQLKVAVTSINVPSQKWTLSLCTRPVQVTARDVFGFVVLRSVIILSRNMFK